MAENLKVVHYRNGDAIPSVSDSAEWHGLDSGAYCKYNNDEGNVATYGLLYNWYAASDDRNIAPAGWHVPTVADWETLTSFLGGYIFAGGKMKETGSRHWPSPNSYSSNESGFSALPGGYRKGGGTYLDLGYYAIFWSSTEYDITRAWGLYLYYIGPRANLDFGSKLYGCSVRCVKD